MGLQGAVTDITKRKQVEEERRLLSARTEAILASVPDIVMEVDRNKVYTWANDAGRQFFGDDVVGHEASYYFEGEQNTYRIVQPDDYELVVSGMVEPKAFAFGPSTVGALAVPVAVCAVFNTIGWIGAFAIVMTVLVRRKRDERVGEKP